MCDKWAWSLYGFMVKTATSRNGESQNGDIPNHKCVCVSVWARERCRISPSYFLTECQKRRLLNKGSFVLMCFALFVFSGLCSASVFVFLERESLYSKKIS